MAMAGIASTGVVRWKEGQMGLTGVILLFMERAKMGVGPRGGGDGLVCVALDLELDYLLNKGPFGCSRKTQGP